MQVIPVKNVKYFFQLCINLLNCLTVCIHDKEYYAFTAWSQPSDDLLNLLI